jgi:hypothetical protein
MNVPTMLALADEMRQCQYATLMTQCLCYSWGDRCDLIGVELNLAAAPALCGMNSSAQLASTMAMGINKLSALRTICSGIQHSLLQINR